MAFATSDQDYYENKEHWGEDAFVTLESIIDNIILLADDDSYFKNIKRFRASILGKLCIKKMNVDIKQSKKAIAFQLAPHRTFPHPRYMTKWFRVSVINDCGKLQPLYINNTLPQIHDYLQDHNWELKYDQNGEIKEAASFHAEEGTCIQIEQCTDKSPEPCECECDDAYNYSDSWVKDESKESYFLFSDDLVDKEIVIEFETAGLDGIADCDIKVHHDMELTVMNYIQYNLLRGKRNTPNQDWKEYYQTYKIEKRRSEVLLGNKITVDRILEAVSLRYNN